MYVRLNSDCKHSQNRKTNRFQLQEYYRVYDNDSKALLGYVLDISSTGLQLVSREPVEDLPVFTLGIELPYDATQVRYLVLPAQLIWRKADVIPCYFDAGFAFNDLNEFQQASLGGILARHVVEAVH